MSADPDKLNALVKDAYNSAIGNDYTFEGWTLYELANDMLAYDESIIQLDPSAEEIVVALKAIGLSDPIAKQGD